jgi:hypothetical protein
MPPDPRPTALEAAREWLKWNLPCDCDKCVDADAGELAALITRREREAVEVAIPKVGKSDEDLARAFHETYERLAPKFGYRTREPSAKPWVEVPETNRNLMIAVCSVIRPEIEREAKVEAVAEAKRDACSLLGSADPRNSNIPATIYARDKRISDKAVAQATPEIKRRAKQEALENLRKVIASGASRSYADATLETLAWVDERIEDAIKAEGGSDAGRGVH